MGLSKQRVLDHFRASLRAALAAQARATDAARHEATGAESRAENKYDTRATEASYLAAGQGERLQALRQVVAWLDQLDGEPCSVAGAGALVGLVADGAPRIVLLGPVGGHSVGVDGHTVALISVRAPLGEALLGAEEDDEVEHETPRGVSHLAVAWVR